MTDSFCPLPWLQVSVKPSGMMTTCCVMKPLVKDKKKSHLQTIQKKMKKGEMAYSRLWWENNDNVYMCGKDSMLDVLNANQLKN